MQIINYTNGKTILKGSPNELAHFIMLQEQIQFNIDELFNQISEENNGSEE